MTLGEYNHVLHSMLSWCRGFAFVLKKKKHYTDRPIPLDDEKVGWYAQPFGHNTGVWVTKLP